MRSKGKFYSLVYHDIFEYPLTEEELEKWEMGRASRAVRQSSGDVRPEAMPAARSGKVDRKVGDGKVQKTGEYYHLPGRAPIVLLRNIREQISKKKILLAKKAAKVLSSLPTIKFIGVTGGLAMNNAGRDSDIDLFIITRKRTLWATRVMIMIVSKFQGFKVRRATESEKENAICFNLWMDEGHLEIPRKMRSLYAAHEVLQVVPLVNKDDTFDKFLDANKWALEFWPNARSDEKRVISDKSGPIILSTLCILLATIFEPFAYRLQLLYMRRRRTRELIEPGCAFFHPIDWGEYVMREFEKRLRL